MLRGPARPAPDAPAVRAPSAPVADVPGGRVVLVGGGRRVARPHLAGSGRRPAAQLRAGARHRRRLRTWRRCGRRRPNRCGRPWPPAGCRRRAACARRRATGRATDGPALDVLPDYIFAQALVRYGFLREEPHVPEALAAKPLWQILSERGMRVGLVGWPLTHPAPTLRGYVVSDVLHRVDDARLALEGADAVAPISMWAPIAAARSVSLDPDPHDVLAKADGLPHAADVDVRADPAPVQADSLHLRIFEVLEATARTSRFVARAAARPGRRGPLLPALRRARGLRRRHRRRAPPLRQVLDDYYGVLDAMVGRLYATLGPDDLVLDRVEPRHGAAHAAQARARAAGRRPAGERHPRTRPRRLRHGLRPGGARRPAPTAARSPTSRRRCSTSWACQSAATWTAPPAPTSSSRRSRPAGRWRSSRVTGAERARNSGRDSGTRG